MSKKVTVDERYREARETLHQEIEELLQIINSLRSDLWWLARLFDKKNGIVTREDVQQALRERRELK